MEIKTSGGRFADADVQALAVAVFKDEKADEGFLKELDAAAGGLVRSVLESEELKGKEGETVYIHLSVGGGMKATRLLLIGVGERNDYKRGQVSQFAGALANEPGAYRTTTVMGERAQEIGNEFGRDIGVVDPARIEGEGVGAFLSVARGSDQPPKMIVLKYMPEGKASVEDGEDYLALVGKGITFDTGGISIKPSENMELMKYDMTGGATVIGVMRAVAQLKPPIPVLGVVPATENMPSGKATKPGDVVRAMTGKTIEVINTDAEGRLILADAVAYAKKLGATRVVDMATLTGAVSIALGDVNTGILGTDQELIDEVIESGREVGEKFWQLPLDKEYTKQIKSDIADIKNVGGRKAGTITAAAFIKEFADGISWAHLDIAGTAWGDEAKPFRAKGPTGVAVRTLLNFIERASRRAAEGGGAGRAK